MAGTTGSSRTPGAQHGVKMAMVRYLEAQDIVEWDHMSCNLCVNKCSENKST